MVSTPVEFSSGEVTHHIKGAYPNSACCSKMGKTVYSNAAVVAIINSGSSKDAEVMHLVRCLAFVAEKFNFVVVLSHIKGTDNDLADALSRDRAKYFLSHYPQAQPHPSEILPNCWI